MQVCGTNATNEKTSEIPQPLTRPAFNDGVIPSGHCSWRGTIALFERRGDDAVATVMGSAVAPDAGGHPGRAADDRRDGLRDRISRQAASPVVWMRGARDRQRARFYGFNPRIAHGTLDLQYLRLPFARPADKPDLIRTRALRVALPWAGPIRR
jgi:hypothetical protein